MRWTMQRKLYAGFGLAAVMMASCTSIARWAQSRAEVTQNAITKIFGTLNDLEYLDSYVRGVTVAQRAFIISGDQGAVAGIPAMRKDADVVSARVLAAIAGDAELTQHFLRFREFVKQRRAFVDKLNKARKDEGFDAAKALFATGEDDRLLSAMEAEFAAMKSRARDRLNAEQADNDRLQRRIAWSEMLAVLLALALLAATAVTLTRSITRNVQISVELVSAMAHKDMSGADGTAASDDELAGAIEAINRMKRAMTEALSEVSKSSAQVAAAGTEMAASTKEISTSSHREQMRVEMFASSLAEMNATVKDVAGNSNMLGELRVEDALVARRQIMDDVASDPESAIWLLEEAKQDPYYSEALTAYELLSSLHMGIVNRLERLGEQKTEEKVPTDQQESPSEINWEHILNEAVDVDQEAFKKQKDIIINAHHIN